VNIHFEYLFANSFTNSILYCSRV